MSHLSLETIARLVDEQPSALDNAHLEACATCRAELQAMRADVAALGALPEMMPADDAWDAIESRLEAEGLLRARTDIIPLRRRTWSPLARAAAVAAVFLGGTVVGHALNGSSNATSGSLASNTTTPTSSSSSQGLVAGTTTTPAATPTGTVASNNVDNSANSVNATGTTTTGDAGTAAAPTSQTAPRSSVRLASTGNATRNRDASANDRTGDAALRSLRDAEDKYFSALKNYSVKAGTETSDPNARLAALEGIVLTTGAALRQSPTDPVINGYHLTALAQRDAMLKQIKATPATSW